MTTTRQLILLTLLVFLGHTKSVLAQESPKDFLPGIWRHVSMVRVVNGTTLSPQQFDGNTTLEFKSDGKWILRTAYNIAAGTYIWKSANEIETTTWESGLIIQIGTISLKQVRIDAERLNLITVQTKEEAAKFYPPPRSGGAIPFEVTVVSIFGRIPSLKD